MSHGMNTPGSALRAMRNTLDDWAAAGDRLETPQATTSRAALSALTNHFKRCALRANIAPPSYAVARTSAMIVRFPEACSERAWATLRPVNGDVGAVDPL